MKRYLQFANAISHRLLAWSVFSMVTGGWLAAHREPFKRGVGLHFFAWGLIDALIAAAGLVNNRRLAAGHRKDDPASATDEAHKLKLILWVNSALDVFYVASGVWLFRRRGKDNPNWRGQGVGVMIQSGFLLLFDVWHALKLGDLTPSLE